MNELRAELERRKGQKRQLEKTIASANDKLALLSKQRLLTEEAQTVIQKVAQMTQDEIKFHITDIANLAMAAIFDAPYEMSVDFTVKRGKVDAELFFTRLGHRIDPLKEAGGGVVDIASFALRLALWCLKSRGSKTRNTIILDEPFRFLSQDLQPKASVMVGELSKRLNMQIIMVTHNESLIEAADKVFYVTNKNGVSHVKER